MNMMFLMMIVIVSGGAGIAAGWQLHHDQVNDRSLNNAKPISSHIFGVVMNFAAYAVGIGGIVIPVFGILYFIYGFALAWLH